MFRTSPLPRMVDWYCKLPGARIDHRPTSSLHHRDPDGNEIEMQVDAFPDEASINACMRSEAFARNPIGIPVIPDEPIAQCATGVPGQRAAAPRGFPAVRVRPA